LFKILIDTCVWLDLAKDPKNLALVQALETMVKRGDVSLIIPRVVVDEFARNKARVAKEGAQSLSSALRRVREAVWRLDAPKRRAHLAKRLSDLDLKLSTLGELVLEGLGLIDTLLQTSPIIETSEAMKARGAERALSGAVPFQRNKNSMGDAILIETYAETLRAPAARGTWFVFVTHNKHDFSLPDGDHRKPHPEFAPLFSKIRSLYCVTLADALRRVDASLLTEQMMMQESEQEPRSASEIIDAITVLVDKVWYNRHQVRKERIEEGKNSLVGEETYPRPPGADTIRHDIWARALKAARRVEKRYGLDNLGPWDDFEWGMINGKLSALRWVLGDEWDMLDT
jgi:predicted nucleic acid-binding protein